MDYTYEDYQRLAEKVLVQAMHDYVKLMHSSTRKKKSLREAFICSVDMFFDPTFRFKFFFNDEGKNMDINDFLCLAADRENINLNKLHKHLYDTAQDFWKDQRLMNIPDVLIYKGQPFYILHKKGTQKYSLDLDENIIYIDESNKDNDKYLISASIDIILDEQEISMSSVNRQKLSTCLHELLTINNCFK